MFSYDERMKAVQLLLQYDMSYASVIRELGYPSRGGLCDWYEEYIQNGDLHRDFIKKSKFTEEECQKAIDYYLEHGKCISRTVRSLGYPSRPMLDKWINDTAPELKKHCRSGGSLVKYSKEEKEQAVIDLCSRNGSAKGIALEHGVTRETLYNWKGQLLSNRSCQSMSKQKKEMLTSQPNNTDTISDLVKEKEQLSKQIDDLHQEIYRLRLEHDILERAAEVIKKDQGISLNTLTNQEKAIVISALRDKYLLKDLLVVLDMTKSSYCYQMKVLTGPDKYADLRQDVKQAFLDSSSRYEYRRIYAVVTAGGRAISEKVIRRIMSEEQLIVLNIKRKKYSSHQGEISPEVENVVQRNFHSEMPNSKWLTDITEFHIPAGKIYLSPIIDCLDGLAVSWSIGTSPDANLVNAMLDEAISILCENEHPIIHSDGGCHYRWPGWIERMEKANLTRSMSKKGCSPDNSVCEGFFGRLKNEMFYGCSRAGVSIDEFIQELDSYIRWYNEKRIKLSLDAMSPLDYRKSMGLVA